MGSTNLTNIVPQYTEAESREIYDFMLATGRIIQVTSNGVRVFYKTTQFSADEVLKARRVFPAIDRNDKLDQLLDRLYGQTKREEDVRQEIIEAIYRPIKKEIDEILIDTRNFLADHTSMAKIRTDLNSVIKNLDGLTLNMLSKVLHEDKSRFKRNIEFAVYSGLIASVLFGDFKTRQSERKIVEDVILIAIIYGAKDHDIHSRMYSNLRSKGATKHYKLDFILAEVISADKSKANIISEVIKVAERYTDILDEVEGDPIRALTRIQEEANDNTAVGTGALFTKYTLREYRNRYKKLDEKLRDELRRGEDKLRVEILKRIARDSKIIHKLGEFFMEDIMVKQAFAMGLLRTTKFREFYSIAEGIRQNCQNYITRLKGSTGQAYRALEDLMQKAIETVELAASEYQSLVRFDVAVPDEEIWSCVAAGNHYKDIDFIIGHTIRSLTKCSGECRKIFSMNPKLDYQRNFAAIRESIFKLRPYMSGETTTVYDVTKIARMTTSKLKDTPGVRVFRGIPQGPIKVPMEPFKIEEIISTIMENAADAIEQRVREQSDVSRENSQVHHINIILKNSDEKCRIRVQDSGGGMDQEAYKSIFVQRQPYGPLNKGEGLLAVQKYIEDTPGASIAVDIKEGKGTSVDITLPVTANGADNDHSTENILACLEKRHWNV